MKRFPGVAEWLGGLACTLLIAIEIQTRGDLDRLQSSTSYYFDSPWIRTIHTGGLVVDGVFLGLVALWLVHPLRGVPQRVLPLVAALGIALSWGELFYALRLQSHAIYVLQDLPFQPINNGGVIAAQVFGTYLLLRAPTKRLSGFRFWVVGAGLAVALWFFQIVLWKIVVSP